MCNYSPGSPEQLACDALEKATSAVRFIGEYQKHLPTIIQFSKTKKPEDYELYRQTMAYYLNDPKAVVNKSNIDALASSFSNQNNMYFIPNVLNIRNHFINLLRKLKAT